MTKLLRFAIVLEKLQSYCGLFSKEGIMEFIVRVDEIGVDDKPLQIRTQGSIGRRWALRTELSAGLLKRYLCARARSSPFLHFVLPLVLPI